MPVSKTSQQPIRLIKGDCLDILPSFSTKSVNAVITDPPYGIGYHYASHDDNRDDWFSLMDLVLPELRRIAKFVIMPCCGIARLRWWYTNHSPDWIVVWHKGSPGHRSCVGFNDWEAHLTWGYPDRPMHDYFKTPCGFADNGHPCPKPQEYTDWLVTHSTNPCAVVLDPFMGSGTTGVSCVTNRRRFIGIEKDPEYFAIAERRIEIASKGKAAWMLQDIPPPLERLRGQP